MDKIGERIKIRREKKSLTLLDLANSTGVTKGFLSQIENGHAFPSIVTLKKIADRLQSSIGELLGEKERLLFNPLIRQKDRKFVKENDHGARLYLLSHHDPNKQMETYFLELESNATTANLIDNIAGQTFCYVINGTISIHLKNNEYILKTGDCLYYNLQDSNHAENCGHDISRMIWVINHSLI